MTDRIPFWARPNVEYDEYIEPDLRVETLEHGVAVMATGATSATSLSPSVPVTRFDVAYEPGRFAWRVGEAVVVMPAVRFGSGLYEWSVAAGSLPPGLVVGSLGSLYGASQTPGGYAWSILVRDLETGASVSATASAEVK